MDVRTQKKVVFSTPEKFPEPRGPCIHLENTSEARPQPPTTALVQYPFWSPNLFLASYLLRYLCAAANATALYMWRSNVLRLRKCSSAGGARHGVTRRWHSSEKSLPITQKEFDDALDRVLAVRRMRLSKNSISVNKVPIGMCNVVTDEGDHNSQLRSGLAISGGVDSMALAFLYARAREANKLLPKAHGFVVDHKARPESTEEAQWVADQLRSRCKLLLPYIRLFYLLIKSSRHGRLRSDSHLARLI